MTAFDAYMEDHPEADESEVTPQMVSEYFESLAEERAADRAEDRILFPEDEF